MDDMDIDLEHVPSQVGTAILDLDGKVIKVTGDFLGRQDDCGSIYKILLDVTKCIGNDSLRRLTVSFSGHSFMATIGKNYIFIVKVGSQ